MMAGIRGRDTQPERMVRSGLHRAGLRFRLHASRLPGRPDLVLARHRVVVFVHGCYWHRHEGCRLATTPGTRAQFWATKFEQNVIRDQRNEFALCADGWRVAIVWECGLRAAAPGTLARLVHWIREEHDLRGMFP